jgi:hypothetical protein
MGNPWLLATDFQPTVTYGLISGVNRYPRGRLAYATRSRSIRRSTPATGGPLFNVDGELTASTAVAFDSAAAPIPESATPSASTRSRTSWVIWAADRDHACRRHRRASYEEDASGRLLVRAIKDTSDVRRRGLDLDDELLSFAGRTLISPNQFKNILSIYPRGWRMPLVYRHENDKKEVEKREVLVRLEGWVAERAPAEPQPEPLMPGARSRPDRRRPELDPQKLCPIARRGKWSRSRRRVPQPLLHKLNAIAGGLQEVRRLQHRRQQWTLTTEDEVKAPQPRQAGRPRRSLDGGGALPS